MELGCRRAMVLVFILAAFSKTSVREVWVMVVWVGTETSCLAKGGRQHKPGGICAYWDLQPDFFLAYPSSFDP
ncbi:hypothetical protein DL96DRAFT_1631364 [Flagelloscypha sp. PMI_526]|nr:hypothetical protein DL96DRAFT_1631364 [Flagelloscypha sp. PMI_526]